MRAAGSGPLGALLMLAPLVAVPIVAVVGIPQFTPGSSPPPAEAADVGDAPRHPLRRARNSSQRSEDYRVGESATDDLFRPLDDADTELLNDPLAERPSSRSNTRSGSRSSRTRTRPDAGELDEYGDTGSDADFESDMDYESTASRSAPRSRVTSPRSRGTQTDERYGEEFEPEGLDDQFEPDVNSGTASRNRERTAPRNSNIEQLGFEDAVDAQSFESTAPPARKRTTPREPEQYADAGDPTGLSDAPPFERRPPKSRTTTPRNSEPLSAEAGSVTGNDFEADPSSAAPATNEFTWRVAARQLRTLGVQKYHFTYLEGQDAFLFTCYLGSAGDAQRYEAQAEEPLLAVRDVLRQLQSGEGPTSGSAAARAKPRTTPRG